MTIEQLKTLNPCEDALAFVEHCGSVSEAWRRCDRGDWMFWLLRAVASEKIAQQTRDMGNLMLARLPADLAVNEYGIRALRYRNRLNEEDIDPNTRLLRLSLVAAYVVDARHWSKDRADEWAAQADDLRRLLPADFLEVGVTFVRPVP